MNNIYNNQQIVVAVVWKRISALFAAASKHTSHAKRQARLLSVWLSAKLNCVGEFKRL